MSVEQRKILEREFHDRLRDPVNDTHVMDTRWTPELERTIQSNPLWVNMKYYSVERRSRAMVLGWFARHGVGKRVLDYCCGNGEDGRILAKLGAMEGVGIDISEVSVRNCERLAEREGLSEKTSYLVRDAEDTGFKDNSFDIITEYGALHHLDLKKAFAELARILAPEGKALCNEALAHNPFIHLYRKRTKQLRTAWEMQHILRRESIRIAEQYFDKVEIHFFHFLVLLAVPFRNRGFFNILLRFLEALDSVLLATWPLKWWAWQIVLVLSEPRKRAALKD
jgi:ubiquinone/menaquinone biosynthesis C-methylase UbiE